MNMGAQPQTQAFQNPGNHNLEQSRHAILQALSRLDDLLGRAVEQAESIYGKDAVTDPFRGLHINKRQVDSLLSVEPGAPLLWFPYEFTESENDSATDTSRLSWLQRVFALSPFEIDVLLITLAPEIDLRYERLYAFLQDDVTKKWPTVDLTLNLLCPSAEAKLKYRSCFATNSSLLSNELLHLIPDSNQSQPSLLAHYLKLDDQIVRFLLDQSGLDSRLESFCKMVEPNENSDGLPIDTKTKEGLSILTLQARQERQPLQLYFFGPAGTGKRRCAEALAFQLGMPLLVVHLSGLRNKDEKFDGILMLLFREAWFNDAILLLEDIDDLFEDQASGAIQRLVDKLADDGGISILTGKKTWVRSSEKLRNMISVPFQMPGFIQRQVCWQNELARNGIDIDVAAVDALTQRFRLTPSQIRVAIATARGRFRWRLATEQSQGLFISRAPTLPDLFAAARAQSGYDLVSLAQKIEPIYTWKDIILPKDTMAQLHEICQWVVHRHKVLGEWGFDRKLSLGKGVNALFAGPSGVGKTMAAEVIAHELGLDLFKIDLSGVVSKYIGETEKNLDRIFTAAENANAILLFDEADALFGKRSEVRDSHDRYANIETSYLLQKMEQFDGIALLSTNQRQNMDTAFTRRLAFTIHFSYPDEASRQKIWEAIWSAETPLADDVNLKFLANKFKLSGGNIKNIALAASYLAAKGDGPITMVHLLQATRREYLKMGKVLSETELQICGAGDKAERVING